MLSKHVGLYYHWNQCKFFASNVYFHLLLGFQLWMLMTI